ncbi:ion transporter [Leptolyngbya valderiana BDU 20041]|nr:ion transporter [Leptolyngbya valderiana BDU 20041]PPT08792.1 Potassium voltage-gated channel subfamily KQT putative potassium channel VIC family [Geitlerinema sp. FC II]
MSVTLKRRIYKILETSDPNVPLSRIDDFIVTVLVVLDVLAFVLATSDTIAQQYDRSFEIVDWTAQIFFTIGYLLRLWSCTADRRYRSPVRGRIRYGLTPLAIIDLMAILPFYILLIFPQLKFIQSTRLFRLFRLLKISRYSKSLRTLGRVLESKRRELVMTLFSVLILLVFASSLMFFAETQAQPEAFPSIPAAMWWGVVTLTTVGYGDVYPVTPIGKLFGALLAFLGIGLFALPAGIIASGFSEQIERQKARSPEKNIAKPPLETDVEQSAELMKRCLDIAYEKFSDRVRDEAILRDLAVKLYDETQHNRGR